MKLRYRLLLSIGITLACMVGGMYVMSSHVMLASFLDLEHQDTDRDVQRATQALDQMVDELGVKSVDWGSWDDTYKFMLDKNKAYVESNLTDVSLVNLQLDLMLFISPDQKTLYAKGVSRVKGVAAPQASQVTKALTDAGVFKKKELPADGISGFMTLQDGPVLVSIRSIHNSMGKGAPHGWLVFCRRVNAPLVDRLEEITRLNLETNSHLSEPLLPAWARALAQVAHGNHRFVTPVSEGTIAGYTAVLDLQGRPSFLLKLEKPRQIYQQGLASISFMARMILIAGVWFGLVALIVLERFALSRLSRLSSQVEQIGDEAKGIRINLPGRDELTHLASRINQMLAKLERRSLEIAAKNEVLENAVEGISELDSEGTFIAVNSSFARMLGYAPDELIGRSSMIVASDPGQQVLAKVLKDALDRGRAQAELEGVCKDGLHSYFEVTVIRSADKEGSGIGIHCFMKDISERKRLEGDIEFQAFHDRLTGLPNRSLFQNRLEKAILKSRRNGLGTAAMFIDLDNFKLINDNLGHAAGDRMLQVIAQRLEESVRVIDTVSRLGGDEFTILLEELTDIDEALEICHRVLDNLNPPMDLTGAEAYARGSIGIAYTADATMSAETLMKNADRAMYLAKSHGKGGFVLYDQNMHDEALIRIDLEASLEKAVENDEIYLEYQPLIDLNTGGFIGVEALARWRHQRLGLIPPTQFISIAEESGLIIPMGYFILEEACRQLQTWSATIGANDLTVSVNVSGKQLQRPDVVERVMAVIERTGLPPHRLTLEITESVLMSNRQDIRSKLLQLKQIGVKLALDDFGTGFSSLSTLSSFPVDILKIDRSFVCHLEEDGESKAIVEAIMAMSRSMKIDVIGEGIESGYQMLALKAMGCKTGQGYLFDCPLTAELFEARFRSGGSAEALEIKRRQLLEIQEMFRSGSDYQQEPAA